MSIIFCFTIKHDVQNSKTMYTIFKQHKVLKSLYLRQTFSFKVISKL